MRFYGEITRSDDEQRMVWGYASTEQRGTDGKVIKRCAMEAALDDYMAFANIREMHQPSAVGVAREASVDDTGLYIGAHVVDDQAWEKVKAGVYRAFSVRAKITGYDPTDATLVTDMLIREISLVDRPGDPGAVFDVWRAADVDDDDDLDPTSNDAAPGAEEDDMSRAAAARKPAAVAAPAPAAAPAQAEAEVQRAEDEPAPEAAPAEPAPAAEDPPADAPAEEAAADAGEPAAEAEAPAEVDPVTRAVESAAAAVQAVEGAIETVERAASEPAPETPAVPACVVAGAEVRRSLSMVNRLGYLLSELTYIIFEADFEKELEGDESTVPAQLRAALGSLATAYRSMSEEEVAELLKNAGVDAVERSIVVLTLGQDELLRSADVEISPEQAGQLQTLFDGFVSRGWAPVLAAPEGEDDLVRQVAALTADKDTLLRTVDGLTERMTTLSETVTRLADTAAPAKTGGSLARAVGKEEDVVGTAAEPGPAAITTEDVQRVLDGMPDDERAMYLTRAALARPIAITRANPAG